MISDFHIPNKTIVVDFQLFLRVIFGYVFGVYLIYKLIIY